MDPEVLVERGHRDTDPCLLANKQFEVAKDEVALGQHMHLEPVLQQQLAAATGQPPIPFDRLPAVTGTAYEDLTRLRMAELPPSASTAFTLTLTNSPQASGWGWNRCMNRA